jgi:hypothetical protein
MNKNPSNWIQGLSVLVDTIQERKKQGITTVMPSKKPDKKIHYDVGQVDIVVDHSHMNKLRVLHMTMSNWGKNYGHELESEWIEWDASRRKMYEADLHLVEELTERGTETMLESDTEFLGTSEFLTKKEMLDMNILFKTYGGKRATE